MPATHQFSESNLVGEVETTPIANINFGSVDEAELVPATAPILRETASFEKYIRAKFTGTWTEISNMKFWKSLGDYVAGESIKAEANIAYATPSETPMTGTGVDDVPITVETALEILSAEGEIAINYGVTGVSGYTNYIKLQLQTTISTPAGAVNQKTFTFQYDEI